MKIYKDALGLVLVMAMFLALGCPKDDEEGGEDTIGFDTAETPEDTVASLDEVDEDTVEPPADTVTAEDTLVPEDTALAVCDDPAALREKALTHGTQILNGVTLDASTPIASIVAAPADYEGQLVQIEGFVSEHCTSAGCWAKLSSPEGDNLVLKVDDGFIDFRDYLTVGNYAVGEGLSQEDGGHGHQIFIQDHGAMIGTDVCAPYAGN